MLTKKKLNKRERIIKKDIISVRIEIYRVPRSASKIVNDFAFAIEKCSFSRHETINDTEFITDWTPTDAVNRTFFIWKWYALNRGRYEFLLCSQNYEGQTGWRKKAYFPVLKMIIWIHWFRYGDNKIRLGNLFLFNFS